jgi:hypothetical protein
MVPRLIRIFTANIVFLVGLLLMILGISSLLGFLEGASKVSVFFAFMLVLAGAICAIFAIRLDMQAAYLFFASLLIMAGFFIFLQALGIISLPFSRAWPLLSVFSGLALLPLAWRKRGGPRVRYIVCACAFVVLGCVLLVFSLRVVPFSFRYFITNWWPLLFALGGLTLVLIAVCRNIDRENRE